MDNKESVNYYVWEGEAWDFFHYDIPRTGDHFVNGSGEVEQAHPDYYYEYQRMLVTRRQVVEHTS